MPNKHKPDCAVNELSYGVNPRTCGADKPAAPNHIPGPCLGLCNGADCDTSPDVCPKYKELTAPPAPTGEVWEAQERLAGCAMLHECCYDGEGADLRTILAALTQAQGEVKRLTGRVIEENRALRYKTEYSEELRAELAAAQELCAAKDARIAALKQDIINLSK